MYTIGNIYEVPTQIRSLSLTKRIAASGNVIVALGNLGARLAKVRFCIKMCKLSRSGRFFGVFSKSFALFYLGIDLVFTYFIGFKLLCKGPRDVSMRRTVFNTWQLTASRESHCVDRAVAFTPRFHISEINVPFKNSNCFRGTLFKCKCEVYINLLPTPGEQDDGPCEDKLFNFYPIA